MKLFSGLGLFLSICSSHAVILPFTRRDAPHSTSLNASAISEQTDDLFNFVNEITLYAATVYVEGQPYVVQLDTGSSDLWIDGTPDSWADTGYNTSVTYGDGTVAAGPVGLANVTFGDFTVGTQVLISAPGSNATTHGKTQGLLGLGARFNSRIYTTLKNTTFDGSTFLDHVFGLYPNEPNYITFLLTRSDVGTTDGGVFTIGETAVGLGGILEAPQLAVAGPEAGAWQTLMDAVEINGVRYNGNSTLEVLQGSSKTLALLDSGTTAAFAPPYYVDAMYKDLPGAIFNGSGVYILPCDTKINISMIFGDYSYPMHPIDAVMVLNANDTTGSLICSGVFQYIDPSSGIDFLLGDSFLRNVYSLYDYGNWTEVGSTNPYMQIWSVTDPDAAWVEFDTLYKARFDALFGALLALLTTGGEETTTVTVTEFVTVTPSATLSSASAPTGATDAAVSPENFSVQGAISGDSSDSQSADLNTLIRNSYIVIGLASGAVLLLVALCLKAIMPRGSSKGYSRVREVYIPPTVDKPYSAEASYSDQMPNPYSNAGH